MSELFASKYSDLREQLFSNFGFGIGYGVKEDKLIINESNDTLIQPNMCFHARITLKKVHEKPSKSFIALGETIMIDAQGQAVILTQDICRKFGAISYTIEEDKESQEESKMQDVTSSKKSIGSNSKSTSTAQNGS